MPRKKNRTLRRSKIRHSQHVFSPKLRFEVLENRILLDTVFWKAATSGNWNTAANWLGDQVPGMDDTAVIDAAGADYTVTLDVNPTVAGFTLNSANATFTSSGRTFTVNGSATLSAGDVVSLNTTWAGTGTLTNNAALAIRGNTTISSPFVNAGTLTLETVAGTDSQTVLAVTTGTLVNAPTGVLTVNPAAGSLSQYIDASLDNRGAVNINGYTSLRKENGVWTNTGALTLAAGHTLLASAAGQVFNQDGGAMTIDGAFSSDRGSVFTVRGGALAVGGSLRFGSVDSPGSAFNFNGGVMTGNAPVLLNSALAIGPGSTGPAAFVVSGPSGTFSGDIAAGQSVTVRSGVSLAGGFRSQASLTAAQGFTNAGTLTLETVAGTDSQTVLAVTTGTLVNAPTGVLTVNPAAGSLSQYIDANLDNRGTFQLQNGTFLDMNGALVNLSGATLTGGTHFINGTWQFNNAAITTNAATLVLDGASTQIINQASANALANFAANTATGSFTIQNGRNLNTAGAFSNAGNLSIIAGSTLTVSGAYTQADTGTLTIGVGGPPASGLFGKVIASGPATLDGTLDIRLVNGFGPLAGQSFPIMSFPSRSGDFDEINGLTLARVQIFEVVRGATNVTINALVDATDLAVESITAPLTGTPGENVTIQYTVRNLKNVTALASWFDSVYLSRDGTVDAADLLIGRVEHQNDVAPLMSYTETLTSPLPAAVDDDYRIIVVTDSRGLVPDSNRGNNSLTSAGVIRARLPVLALGQTVTGTIANGQDLYFRLDVPAATDVRLIAEFAAAAEAELYVRFGAAPTRGEYDFTLADVADLRQQLLLTGTAGPYYILLHGREGAGSGAAFSLTAQPLTFAVNGVSPDHGSNVGRATATLTGSGFTPETGVRLTTSGGVSRPAVQVVVKDSNTLFATFDLTGLSPGAYDVTIEDGARTATADGAFTVTTGAPGRLEANISSPDSLRVGREGIVTVEYVNVGETDLPAPLLVVRAVNTFLEPILYESPLTRRGPTTEKRRLPRSRGVDVVQFLAINQDGPAGILTPGARGRFEFTFKPEASQSGQTTRFVLAATQPETPFDWNAFKDDLRPRLVSADAWEAIFANFTARAGATVGEYQALLGENATYLSQLGDYAPHVSRLLNFAFQQADNAYPVGSLTGATDSAAPAPGLPLVFGRTYYQPISRRYRIGAFGRGWTHTWEASARTDDDGNVTILNQSGHRPFLRLTDGSFQGIRGDEGLLTLQSGTYRLRETDGTVTAFGTDGNVSFLEDTQGNRITANYTDGRLTSLAHSSGATFTLSYNAQGRISRLTDQAGRVTMYAYDASGEHLLSVTSPGGTTAYTYESGQGAAREYALKSITYRDGTHLFYDYDSQGRLISQSRDGGVDAVTYTYPTPGAITSTNAAGAASTILYDDAGQVSEIHNALGHILRFSRDPANLALRLSEPGNVASVSRFDDRGNLVSEMDSLGRRIDRTYDATFNGLSSLRDALGSTTTFSRDEDGNVILRTDPDGSAEQFTYDAQGNLVESINRRGQAIGYAYDSRGLLTRREHADGAHEDFTYDARGNLLTAADSQGTTTWEYDAADRLTKVTYPSGRFLQYTYDAGGRRTRMVDQAGLAVNYHYDAAGRLERLTDGNDQLVVGYTYDLASRLARKDLGNGTFATHEYDAAGQLLHLVNHAPDGSVNSRFDYAYDDTGRRTSMTTQDGTFTYGYDATGQLTSVVLPGGRTIQYEYDANGNRLTVADDGALTNYTTNNLNQYTAVGLASYAYDLDGNRIARSVGGETSQYAYDDMDRLVSVVTPMGTWTYEYDSLGNRVASTHNGQRTEYLLDPTGLDHVAAEYDGDGNLRVQYVHSGSALVSQIDSSGAAAYYDFDATGSTAGLTGSAGSYLNQYSYLPFGEQLSASETVANPFTFVGQFGVMQEGNGLDFMRARYYSDEDGRFLSPDPIGFQGGDVNLYRYVANSPVNLIDPSGLFCVPLVAALAAAAGISVGELISSSLLITSIGLLAVWNVSQPLPTIVTGPTIENVPWIPIRPYRGPRVGTGGRAYGVPIPVPGPGPQTVPLPPGTGSGGGPPSPGGGSRNGSSGAAPGGGSGGGAGGSGSGAGLGAAEAATVSVSTCGCGGGGSGAAVPVVMAAAGSGDGEAICEPPVPEDPLDDTETLLVGSADPNDIVGPAGFGAGHFLRSEETLPYLIHFENLPAATAPAQVVVITQQLDADLDYSTFELGDFGFGDITALVPDGRTSLQARIDARPSAGVFVDVSAGIDVTTGLVTWTFTAVDPLTFDLPTDPFGGFLPPNETSPEGEAFVSYLVRSRSTAASGTRIDALARIVFDENAPLDTPPIFNTIDADPPVSNVDPLPTTSQALFNVNWSGADAGGSGIATFDVFVSVDGAAFTLWRDDTQSVSDQYVGEVGHIYAFYSVATDNVGHVEGVPLAADATTRTVPPPDPAPPRVAATVVQSGLGQRSYIDRLHIDFSEEVNLAALIANNTITSAVTLTNLGVHADADSDQPVPLAASQFHYVFNANFGLSRLTWSLDSFAGSSASLADGFYRLKLDANMLRDLAGNPLDGDGNGAGGGDFVLSFHRLQGDADGNMLVDAVDMDLVNAALGARPSSATWNANADLDRDDRITVRDRLITARAVGNAITPPAAPPAPAIALPGDFDGSATVDASDLDIWVANYGRADSAGPLSGDANGDLTVDGTDFLVWQRNLGTTAAHASAAEADASEAFTTTAFTGLEDQIDLRPFRGAFPLTLASLDLGADAHHRDFRTAVRGEFREYDEALTVSDLAVNSSWRRVDAVSIADVDANLLESLSWRQESEFECVDQLFASDGLLDDIWPVRRLVPRRLPFAVVK